MGVKKKTAEKFHYKQESFIFHVAKTSFCKAENTALCKVIVTEYVLCIIYYFICEITDALSEMR